MRFRNLAVHFFIPLVVLSSLLAAAQATVKKLPAMTDASVAAAVRSTLEDSGTSLVRPDGSVLCEIWLRKPPLPAAKGAAAKGAAYPELSPGMFLGVISFPNGGKDFRGQPVKGTFTMRYALLPEDGNHLGVAPTRDFVLLLRAADDADPSAQYDYAQLVKLSAQAAGSNHPAAFLLLPPQPGDVPRTYQNPDGFQVFAGALNMDGGKTVPIALVVKGQAEQ